MTETELKRAIESDTEAKKTPGLEPDEVALLIKERFYTNEAFDQTLAVTTSSRYAWAIAAGWRKQMGKTPDPLKYLSQGNPLSTDLLHDNLESNMKAWIAEAERREAAERLSNLPASDSPPRTRTLGVSIRF